MYKSGLSYNNKTSPFVIISKRGNIICHYSPDILKKDKRYSIINVQILSDENKSNHYTFIFLDHEKKTVEYYDPHGSSILQSTVTIVLACLKTVFKGYTINKFWEIAGMQVTEAIEKDEEGFCVIWGHMMMHLKLLNLDTPLFAIEYNFIEECKSKGLSLYEVMLNYAYLMRRIIPYSPKKILMLNKLL
jgi:hypothetical protein